MISNEIDIEATHTAYNQNNKWHLCAGMGLNGLILKKFKKMLYKIETNNPGSCWGFAY